MKIYTLWFTYIMQKLYYIIACIGSHINYDSSQVCMGLSGFAVGRKKHSQVFATWKLNIIIFLELLFGSLSENI